MKITNKIITKLLTRLGLHVLLFIWIISTAGLTQAEPYLAVRTGYKCSVCHTNKTGGGKRTGFGVVYTQTTLPHLIKSVADAKAFFDPNLNDYISVGGNVRLANNTLFRDGENDNGFEITEGNVYVQVDVVKDFLTFYVDETVAPGGASNREAFAILHGMPANVYFKAGRMLLPYGFRLWDDDAFIRQKTGFNYANQDLGVEVGLEPGPLSLSVAVTNGTQGGVENNQSKQISVIASSVFRRFRVGGSFSHNNGPTAQRTVGGVFAGLNAGRFTILGEYDVIDDEDDAGEAQRFGNQRLIYAEGNFLITKGINFKFAYDYWDPFTEIDEDERTMYRVGIEPFLTQFLQVRIFYRFREAPPQLVSENDDQLNLELHLFF